jgi:hypothetical protein
MRQMLRKLTMRERDNSCLQDGMLAYYLGQAKMADANVERRIEREPFDYRRDVLGPRKASGTKAPPALKSNRVS